MISLYYEWLLDFVCTDEDRNLYSNLLSHLYNKDFEWVRPLDRNCAVYGIKMRDEWLNTVRKRWYFDKNECSILEVMVSLATRMEENVMSNVVFGDRTAYWFWLMIQNLGLIEMDDRYYEEEKVEKILNKFLDRRYKKDGNGGLFVIKDRNIDMRNVDIWQQAMGFLRKYVENDGEIW